MHERADLPLHVALVTETYPPEVNGVALTVARLVDGLRQRDLRVQVIRPRQGRLDDPGQGELLIPGLPIPGYPGLRFGLPAHRSLRRQWLRDPPDVVHVATEGPLGAAAVGAARSLHLPVSSGFHTNFRAYSRHYRLGWLKSLVGGHLRRFHNRTDLTLAPTARLARELRADGYRNVDILARGVDTHVFNPAQRSADLRDSWGVGPEDLVVAYVGRIAAEKNLGLVTRTFAAIVAQRPDARLLFVGDGPLLDSLRRRHPNHIYAGLRRGEDLAAHYASADLFLFPSLTETFGNVVPEALASGLGVIAFDCAAAADLIEPGRNGITAPPGNDDAFIAAASRLAMDGDELARIRATASASVAHMEWSRIQERFALVLAEVAATHRGRKDRERGLVLASD
ncbi:MAG TPA: glycosyltransferase family 1 protein [Rhodocyclaceae bacterium]|nr:glycosyltransferase family 1 protein [Rhodocyclaceae bacterium]